MATQSGVKKSPFKRMGNYFRSSRAELKKVIWPNKKELTNHTIVVVVICLLISLIVWILDLGVHKLFSLILR